MVAVGANVEVERLVEAEGSTGTGQESQVALAAAAPAALGAGAVCRGAGAVAVGGAPGCFRHPKAMITTIKVTVSNTTAVLRVILEIV
jgi:hypothetical protein